MLVSPIAMSRPCPALPCLLLFIGEEKGLLLFAFGFYFGLWRVFWALAFALGFLLWEAFGRGKSY
jgi:hypothetical protein